MPQHIVVCQKNINILDKMIISEMEISESVPNKELDFALKMKFYA